MPETKDRSLSSTERKREFIDFPVKKIPITLWERFRLKAQADGISCREKVLRLIEEEVRSGK